MLESYTSVDSVLWAYIFELNRRMIIIFYSSILPNFSYLKKVKNLSLHIIYIFKPKIGFSPGKIACTEVYKMAISSVYIQ